MEPAPSPPTSPTPLSHPPPEHRPWAGSRRWPLTPNATHRAWLPHALGHVRRSDECDRTARPRLRPGVWRRGPASSPRLLACFLCSRDKRVNNDGCAEAASLQSEEQSRPTLRGGGADEGNGRGRGDGDPGRRGLGVAASASVVAERGPEIGPRV